MGVNVRRVVHVENITEGHASRWDFSAGDGRLEEFDLRPGDRVVLDPLGERYSGPGERGQAAEFLGMLDASLFDDWSLDGACCFRWDDGSLVILDAVDVRKA